MMTMMIKILNRRINLGNFKLKQLIVHKHHHKNHLLLHGMIPPQMRRVKSQILESFAYHPKEINNLLNY